MPKKRKLPDGMWQRGKVYYSRFCAHGRPVRKRLSADFSTACEMLNDLKVRADRADFGLLDNDYPLDELRGRYLRHCDQTLRPSTVKRYRSMLSNIFDKMTVTKVSQINVDRILTYREDRLAGNKMPSTINTEVGSLFTMLAWGVDHQKIGSNPLAKLKRLSTDKKRKERRSLTVEEIERLFDVSPEHLKPAWRMFCCTGIRHDELGQMRFDDVDFERRVVTIQSHTAKNHKSREIPLDDHLLTTIAELREQAVHRQPVTTGQASHTIAGQVRHFTRDHVFVTLANTPWRSNLLDRFHVCCKKAGIEDAHHGGAIDIHSLRVTFCTLSIENGASPKAVQAIMGHSTLGMTMGIYAKATAGAKRAAVSVLPFAKATQPDHIISMQAHKMRPSTPDETQKPGSQGVA